ncbi:RNA-guided endonuclease InsQ/TnpB family protein [Streptomyces sp. NPDC050145]|uniref:RNA-guided endonuclease InsQ/TnpB family protein n=1 Tax=Streptomyces sp. NPDC050145 TaxID=3365602 RepID=UPI0037BB238E
MGVRHEERRRHLYLNIVRVHRRWGVVNIPKVGRVDFRWTKDLPVGKRVSPLALSNKDHQDHGRPPRLPDGTADRDKWLTGKEKAKLLKLERQAAHRKTFCKRGEKASKRLRHTYDQIKQLRAKATRRALDWQHKTTTHLARTYGVLVVEQLDILGVTKSPAPKPDSEQQGAFLRNGADAKAGLNRSIAQEAWGRTVTMLTYKTACHGGRLVKVAAPHTSQRCSACGFTTPGSRESQELFACKNPDCGWTANADWNAARNILHLYRIGHVIVEVPAAGRRGRRAGKTVKPVAAR